MSIIKNKIASINIDLDTVGSDLNNWNDFTEDSNIRLATYKCAVPRILDLFSEFNIKATFFIIGIDTIDKANRQVIKRISNEGHELANHTWTHDKHISRLNVDEIRNELLKCTNSLEDISGKSVVGFRAPGYTISSKLIQVVSEEGFLYDASVNTSKFYNYLKTIFLKYIVKNKASLCIQSKSLNSARREVYWICPKDMVGKRGGTYEEGKILEFPIPVIPIIEFPFVSSMLSLWGYWLSSFLFRTIKYSYFFQYELHDYEFLSNNDFKGLNANNNFSQMRYHLKSDLNDRLNYFRKMLTLMSKYYKFNTLAEISSDITGKRCD